MRTIITIIAVVSGVFLFLAGTVYWFEAEKEVRILCSIFQEGQALETVQQTLDTGNLLIYTQEAGKVVVNSDFTLNSTECIIHLSNDDAVMKSEYSQSFRLERVTGLLAAVLTFGLAIFQLLLALGVPLGEWAWGGKYQGPLPKSLRMGSLISFLILLLGGLSVLSISGNTVLISESISSIVVAILTLLFLISIAGNFNSQSQKERQVMIPLSILLFCSYLVVVVKTFL